MTQWKKADMFSALSLAALVGSIVALQLAAAQGGRGWEMRVCADPDNYPESHQFDIGYDNRIAEILADQLGAEVSFVWETLDPETVERNLMRGECDLIVGAAEGASGVLNTVPYYRTPSVFVFHADAGLSVSSLDDPVLHDLRIATYPNSLEHRALLARGLGSNVVTYRPLGRASGPDRHSPLLIAVESGEVDVAIVYGPKAGYFALHVSDVPLTVVPVTPELDITFGQMFRVWTIGVRPHDTSFRDRLNIALAQRWGDVQLVLEEYGVPLRPTTRPSAADTPSEVVQIGAVLPTPTRASLITDAVGEAARFGALLADDMVAREAERGVAVEVLIASAPTAEAARRAAERLIATEGVAALVGGHGRSQARALSDVARNRNVLFLNTGSIEDDLRTTMCTRNTFHVEASAGMYLDAIVRWFGEDTGARWFIVYEDTVTGRADLDRARAAVRSAHEDNEVAGMAGVAVDQFAYGDVFAGIRDAEPDAVLVLLGAENQEFFLGQYEASGLTFTITGLPDPVMQTRAFYQRIRQMAPTFGAIPRPTLWDPSLAESPAADLNERFAGRSGEPMDPAAWAAYAAVKIVAQSVRATRSTEVDVLASYLVDDATTFELGKAVPLSFRAWSHQLRQPLYMAEIDTGATWGARVSQRVALANVVGEVPDLEGADDAAEIRSLLDSLGAPPPEGGDGCDAR
jgi:ABC-type branched-subunit amino acid transport system substrate-binding protein/ABC-type amino acid transport substrate-binding protein